MDLIDRECLLDNIIEWRAMLTDESEKKLLTKVMHCIKAKDTVVDMQKLIDGVNSQKLDLNSAENKNISGLSFHSKSIFNLGEIYDAVATDPDEESLLDSEIEYIQNAYMFMPYAFLKACEDIVEYTGLSFEGRHTRIYKLKDGCKIKVTAG